MNSVSFYRSINVIAPNAPVGSIHIVRKDDNTYSYIIGNDSTPVLFATTKTSRIVQARYSLDSGMHYSGYEKVGGVFTIKRYFNGSYQVAEDVTNLEEDWNNRETLTYN